MEIQKILKKESNRNPETKKFLKSNFKIQLEATPAS
jgi:hypothetical protein